MQPPPGQPLPHPQLFPLHLSRPSPPPPLSSYPLSSLPPINSLASLQQPHLLIPMGSALPTLTPPPPLPPNLHPFPPTNPLPPTPLPPPQPLPPIISDPKDWSAHNEAGMVMHRNGLLEQAIEHLSLAVQSAPEGSVVRRNLAMVKVDMGTRFKLGGAVLEAISCYEEALQVLNSFAPAYFNLAVIFSERGQYEQALKYYQQAVRYNPNYVEALCVEESTGVMVKRRGEGEGREGQWMEVRARDVRMDDVLRDERGGEVAIQPPIIPLSHQPLYRVECYPCDSCSAEDVDTSLLPFAQYDVSDRHLITVLCRTTHSMHRMERQLHLVYYRIIGCTLHDMRLSVDCGEVADEAARAVLMKRWARIADVQDVCMEGELYDVDVRNLHLHLQRDEATVFRRHIAGVQLSLSSISPHSLDATSSASVSLRPQYRPIDLVVSPLPNTGTVIALSVASPTHRYLLSSFLPTHNWSALTHDPSASAVTAVLHSTRLPHPLFFPSFCVLIRCSNIGVIYKNSAQLSMAIEYYEKALKVRPSTPPPIDSSASFTGRWRRLPSSFSVCSLLKGQSELPHRRLQSRHCVD